MRKSYFKNTISIVLTLCLIFTMLLVIPFMDEGGKAYAVANGTADAMVSHAKSHVGQRIGQFKDCSGYSGDWCAWFVEHCSQKSGCSSIIPTSGCTTPNNLAYSIVNKRGGKITFVNKVFYKAKKGNFTGNIAMNNNYKPKKGDLIIFSSDGSYWWTHVGIVRENCNNPLKNVKTVEGNTGNSSWKLSTVKNLTRNTAGNFNIVAYVTPKYAAEAVNHTFKFELKGGSGSFPNQTAVTGGKLTLPSSTPTKSGYAFKCWYVKRNSDQKWYVSGKGWYKWADIIANNYSPQVYRPGVTLTIDSSWTEGNQPNSSYAFYAQWTPLGTETITNGRYYISSQLNSEMIMTVRSVSTENGANVQLYASKGNAKQTWSVSYQGNGYYKIINANSGKYLDIDGPSEHPGKNVHQWEATGLDSQLWVIDKNADGSYCFVSKYGGKYLDVAGEKGENSANIIVNDGNGRSSQRWYFIPYSESSDTHIHQWSSVYTTDIPADCLKEGQESIHCTICGAIKNGSQRVLPITGHNWVNGKCTVCGKKRIGKIPEIRILTPKSLRGAVTVKWKKLSATNRKKIDKIQIQYSRSKNFKAGVKTVKVRKTATYKKISKLKSGKTYYVRVRAYKMVNGKARYSKWSKVKRVKIR